MPKPIENVPDPAEELLTLRRVNAELLEKSRTRKAKIAELEMASTELQAKLTLSEQATQDAIVGVPLRAMAASISTTPGMWLEAFDRQYSVKSIDGKLTICNASDGKPTAIPFERDALAKHLTETEPDSEATRLFRLITITSRASGGSGKPSGRAGSGVSTPKHQFGIR